jgi:exonuclease III
MSINIGCMTKTKRQQLFACIKTHRPDVVVVQDTRTRAHEDAHPTSSVRAELQGYKLIVIPATGDKVSQRVGGQWIIFNTATVKKTRYTIVFGDI